MHYCRPNGVSRRNALACDFLSSEMYCTLVPLCLCTQGGRVRSSSVLLRWEQTQLTASFLTVNTAAPLRHGSGTPLHLPSTASLTHQKSLSDMQAALLQPPKFGTVTALRHAARHVTRWSALPFMSSQTHPEYHPYIHTNTHTALYPSQLTLSAHERVFEKMRQHCVNSLSLVKRKLRDGHADGFYRLQDTIMT